MQAGSGETRGRSTWKATLRREGRRSGTIPRLRIGPQPPTFGLHSKVELDMRFVSTAPALVLVLVCATASPPAAQAELLAHRAIYDLVLAGGSRGIDDARGRIVFEFEGDACEGYATKVRQVTTISGAGTTRTLDMNTTTFEEGDGSRLRFRSETRADGVRISRVEGEAAHEGEGMLLELRRPGQSSRTFDQRPAFPVAHIRAILATAREGSPTLAMEVYDGADDGLEIYDTLAIIGRELPPLKETPFPAISGTARWPVTLSYFKQDETQGEQMPAYVIAFQLHENGVSTDLSLDFGDFSMTGALASLDALPKGRCG